MWWMDKARMDMEKKDNGFQTERVDKKEKQVAGKEREEAEQKEKDIIKKQKEKK